MVRVKINGSKISCLYIVLTKIAFGTADIIHSSCWVGYIRWRDTFTLQVLQMKWFHMRPNLKQFDSFIISTQEIPTDSTHKVHKWTNIHQLCGSFCRRWIIYILVNVFGNISCKHKTSLIQYELYLLQRRENYWAWISM